MSDLRTEKPTRRRITDARKDGNIPRSREMTSAITLIAAMVVLYATAGFIKNTMKHSMQGIFGELATIEVTYQGVHSLMVKEFGYVALMLAPFFAIMIIVGLGVEIAQGGAVVSTKKLELDLNKVNPLKGIGRIFNKNSIFEVAKSFIKMGIVGYMSYKILFNELENIIFLVDQDLPGILQFIGHLSFKIVIHTCGVLIILAVVDLAFVKWRFHDSLKMSKQEIKDEHKQDEGDPALKGKMRLRQLQISRRSLNKIIPIADVVITNPTHYAVALKYDSQKMQAPIVVFKGVDEIAQEAKKVAALHNVTVVENRKVARDLYATVEEGEVIPERLYTAVGAIIKYVYELKRKPIV